MGQRAPGVFGAPPLPYSPCTLLKLILVLTLSCACLQEPQRVYLYQKKMHGHFSSHTCSFSQCVITNDPLLAPQPSLCPCLGHTHYPSLLPGCYRSTWHIESTQAFTPRAGGSNFSRSLGSHRAWNSKVSTKLWCELHCLHAQQPQHDLSVLLNSSLNLREKTNCSISPSPSPMVTPEDKHLQHQGVESHP